MDYLTIATLIISSVSAIASLHLYRIKLCGDCIESDCYKPKGLTPNISSSNLPKLITNDITETTNLIK